MTQIVPEPEQRQYQQQPFVQQTVYVVEQRKTNGVAVAGFVLALISLVFFWVPGLSWVLWLLGLIFSIIGIFKAPRGFAIAGLIISFISIIALLVLLGSIGLMMAL